MAVALNEGERTQLERAMNMEPGPSEGPARASGDVRCESAWEAASRLASPTARPGDVVVYRDAAFLCEASGGRDWSAYKQGPDGSWACDERSGLGPYASFRVDPGDEDGAMFVLASACLATKAEAFARTFAEANPFDARERMASALPKDGTLTAAEEKAGLALSFSAATEDFDGALEEEAERLLDEGAAPEDVAQETYALVRGRLAAKVDEAISLAEVDAREVSKDKVLSYAARASALDRPAKAADERARAAFPTAAVASVLDKAAMRRPGVERKRGEELTAAEMLRRRRIAAMRKHGGDGGEDAPNAPAPGVREPDPFDPNLAWEERPLAVGTPVAESAIDELALDAASWERAVDEVGVEILQSKEASFEENGIPLRETFERTEEGWTYAGPMEAGKSSQAPTAEDMALAFAAAPQLQLAAQTVERCGEVAAQHERTAAEIAAGPDPFEQGVPERTEPPAGLALPQEAVDALAEDASGWRRGVAENGREYVQSREPYAQENGTPLYATYEKTERGWEYGGLAERGRTPSQPGLEERAAERSAERGATAEGLAHERGVRAAEDGREAPSAAALEAASKQTASSIRESLEAAGVEGSTPPGREPSAAATPREEREQGRAVARAVETAAPGKGIAPPAR